MPAYTPVPVDAKFGGLLRKLQYVLHQGGVDFQRFLDPGQLEVRTQAEMFALIRLFKEVTQIATMLCPVNGLSP